MRGVLIETSGETGAVATFDDVAVRHVRSIPAARKQARDLAPLLKELLATEGWRGSDIELVLVDVGPGSYTGLRVGVATAKALCYATGASLVAVPSPMLLAEGAPKEHSNISVIIDAQQGRVYACEFVRPSPGESPVACGETSILDAADWAQKLEPGAFVAGPALSRYSHLVPATCASAPRDSLDPSPASLWALGLQAFQQGQLADFWTLEPLYLRPSSAEIKWDRLHPPP